MLAGVSINNDNFETVSSITYNGVPLTYVNSETRADDARVEIWELVDPPEGTHDVVISFSAAVTRNAVVGVSTFMGVHQTQPLGPFAASNATSNSANLTVPSVSGELVLGVFSCETCTSVTFASPAEEQWNLIVGNGKEIASGSTIGGAGPQVAINASLGTSDHWAIGGVSIRPGSSSTPNNDPPAATDDSATTPETTAVTVDVAANDSDPDGNLDPTSANTTCANGSTGCLGAANGSLTDHADGTLTYTPDPGFNGSDSFVYEICDTDLMCDTATVSITVNPSAVLVDAVSSGNTAGSSLTISHTTSGTDRLMLAGVSINNTNFETVSSITYNGVSLTYVNSEIRADDARVEIWQLVDPPVGTHDVVITFSATVTRHAVAGVTTFTGGDQTDPLGAFAGNNATSNSANLTVPSASGELVLGVLSCETCTSVTFAPPADEQWNLIAGNGVEIGSGLTVEGAGAGVTINASLGTSDYWAMGGVSIKPAQFP
jgi:hypothetical protein